MGPKLMHRLEKNSFQVEELPTELRLEIYQAHGEALMHPASPRNREMGRSFRSRYVRNGCQPSTLLYEVNRLPYSWGKGRVPHLLGHTRTCLMLDQGNSPEK